MANKMDLDGDLQNYFRLALLVNDTTKFLQEIFRIHFKKFTGTTWEDTAEFGEKFVASAVGKRAFDSAKKIQKKILENGDVTSFDIPLLFSLFSTIDFGETEQEKMEVKEIRAAIKELVEVRNQLAHITTLSLSTEEFSILHDKARTAMMALGGDFEELCVTMTKKEPLSPQKQQLQSQFSKETNPPTQIPLQTPNPNPNDESYAALKYWDHRVSIQRQAMAGSIYAKMLIEAMDYFSIGMKTLIKLQEKNCQKDTSMLTNMLHQFSQCFRIADFVAIFTQDVRNNFELIVDRVLNSSFTNIKPSVDLDTRVCKSFLLLRQNSKPPDQILEFLKQSNEMYPNEIYFHRVFCHKLKLLGRLEQCAEAVENSLLKHANDVDLLWTRAQTLKLRQSCGIKPGAIAEIDNGYQMIRAAYSKFLQAAPNDHRNLPECYYALAQIIIATEVKKQRVEDKKKHHKKLNIIHAQLSEEGEESMTLFYQIGLTVENNLAPCFLPYESVTKKKLQTRINLKIEKNNCVKNQSDVGPSKNLGKKPLISIAEADTFEWKLSSLQRLNILVPHRVRVSSLSSYQVKRGQQSNGRKTKVLEDLLAIYFPLDDQKAPTDLSSLKNISLCEMNEDKDQVYKNCVIKLTVMEDTLFDYFDGSIHTVVSDDLGNFQRCTFSTTAFNPEDEELKKFLSFGSTFSLMNPYFCLMTFGGAGLLVLDPKSVLYHKSGKDNPKCRFCGKCQPVHRCECQIALYCDRHCQMKDWNPLNHYLICTHHNEALKQLMLHNRSVVQSNDHFGIKVASGVLFLGVVIVAGIVYGRFKHSS